MLARSLALLQLTAAFIAFGSALVLTEKGVDTAGLIITALAAALFGSALLRSPVSPGARWVPAAGIASTALISLYIYFGGEPAAPFALFYAVAAGATVWCATVRATAVQVLAMVLMCSVAVWTSPEPGQRPWPALAASDLGALIMLCIALSSLTFLIWRFKRRYIEGDRRAAQLVEFSRDAIVGVDSGGTITNWNHAAEVLYEYTRTEALGRSIGILFPRVLRGDEQETLQRVLSGEVIEGQRVERFTRDGSARRISLSLAPITDAHGAVVGAVGINRDVTADLLAAERISLQAAMIDEVDGAVIATDDNGAMTFWSAGAERLFGYDAKAVIGRPIDSLVRGDQVPMLDRIRAAREANEPLEGELDAVGSDGETIPVYFRTRRVPGLEHSDRATAITVVVDITARRDAEAASRRHTEAQQEIVDLGRRALRGESCEHLFERAVGVAARVLSADGAALLERGPADEGLAMIASSGGAGWRIGQDVADRDIWLAEHVLRTRKPIVVEDWEREPRLRGARPTLSGAVRSSVAVAVGDAESPFGVLVVNQARPGGGLGDGVPFLESMANVLADAHASREARREIQRQGLHDSLTGLAEPRPVPRPRRTRARPHVGGRPAARGAHARHRQLQAGQRESRPRDGR